MEKFYIIMMLLIPTGVTISLVFAFKNFMVGYIKAAFSSTPIGHYKTGDRGEVNINGKKVFSTL